MPVYRRARCDTYTAEGVEKNLPVEVNIHDSGSIVVSYEWDGAHIVYNGNEIESGHFEVSAPRLKATATLHRFSGGDVPEGRWVSENEAGMWLIKLGKIDQENSN